MYAQIVNIQLYSGTWHAMIASCHGSDTDTDTDADPDADTDADAVQIQIRCRYRCYNTDTDAIRVYCLEGVGQWRGQMLKRR